jgi:hypothetical protein
MGHYNTRFVLYFVFSHLSYLFIIQRFTNTLFSPSMSVSFYTPQMVIFKRFLNFPKTRKRMGKRGNNSNFAAEIHSRNGFNAVSLAFSGGFTGRDTRQSFYKKQVITHGQ